MRKFLATIAALTLSAPAMADPHIERWKTPHSMGCMLLQECTEGVVEVKNIDSIQSAYPDIPYTLVKPEFNALIFELNRIGVGVYLADGKYFPPGHRGVYHTTENNFFLNVDYMWDPQVLLEVSRHEGWHAAQDCMAGTIDNNSIAIIHHDHVIPDKYTLRAEIAYASNPAVIPWETEAIWAGEEPYATVNALSACQAKDAMWDLYPPTPMTSEWLIKNGF